MVTDLAIQFAARLEFAADHAESQKFSVANLSTMKNEDCRALAAFMRAKLSGGAGGWIAGNGTGTKWRCWNQCGPSWTADRDEATRYARREDAEAVHADDEDAWRVEPYATPNVTADLIHRRRP